MAACCRFALVVHKNDCSNFLFFFSFSRAVFVGPVYPSCLPCHALVVNGEQKKKKCTNSAKKREYPCACIRGKGNKKKRTSLRTNKMKITTTATPKSRQARTQKKRAGLDENCFLTAGHNLCTPNKVKC